MRDRPEFANTVADRVWRAFWKDDGHPLELLTGLVQQNLEAGPIPTSFVAHDGERFLGTVSVIVNDEELRPQYTPWIAALWVDPEDRQQGIGAALVDRAAKFAFTTGAQRVYLLTRERRRAYYEGLGWAVLEADAPELGLHILTRDRGEGHS
ncbi:GNAT family N-acetyltransferase [Microvirga sp. ACRRW]|uniref:GNAT family N-acetyltransferase n=1 Tax=Microvirga sp. ACRRW TaxID=2918205 RepID=UPI001EF66937|nr:GNAT family N-acetyltransferase [Microvirga sp. ACRRW]MCG7394566.1 GNAT family N-acetyltransferase [Microvirga sp. ACRRW]